MATLKFFYNGIKGSDNKLQKCSFHFQDNNGRPNVYMYAKNYVSFYGDVASELPIKNNTDTQTDYICEDTINLYPGDKYFKEALEMVILNSEKNFKRNTEKSETYKAKFITPAYVEKLQIQIDENNKRHADMMEKYNAILNDKFEIEEIEATEIEATEIEATETTELTKEPDFVFTVSMFLVVARHGGFGRKVSDLGICKFFNISIFQANALIERLTDQQFEQLVAIGGTVAGHEDKLVDMATTFVADYDLTGLKEILF